MDGRRVDRQAAEHIGRNVFMARRRAGGPDGRAGSRRRVDRRRADPSRHLPLVGGEEVGQAEVDAKIKAAERKMIFLLQHPLRKRLLGLYVESREPLSPKELATTRRNRW